MPYNELSLEGFIQEFKSVSVGPYPRKFCFVLGAGASKTSGIKTGEELVDIWDRELNIRNSEAHARWKQEHNINDDNKFSFYSHYYAKRFEKDKGKRYRDGYNFLETMIKKARPSCGYVYLALLMANTSHNVVITTNFDHLTEDCLVQYAQTMPMVIGHEKLAPYVTQQILRPTVIKIHRDLLLNPINNPEELNKLHENWGTVLDNIFSNYHPIFIGYAGNDNSVMDFLCNHSEKFNSDEWACPYWFMFGSQQPDKKVRRFLEDTNGYLIHHQGFDQVLIQLGYALDIELPDEETFMKKTKEQYEALLDSVGSFINESNIPTSANNQTIPTAKVDIPENVSQEDVTFSYSQFIRLFINQKYDAAFKIINNLLLRDSDNPRYHYYAGVTLHAMQHYDEALVEKRKAVELKLDNAKYHASLSVTLYGMKCYDEALEEAKKAVGLEPDNAQYHASLSVILRAMKRYEEALEEAKKAVELELDNAICYYQLSATLYEMKRYDEALEEAKKAVELEPDNAQYHGSLGVILHEMKRYDEALEEAKKAVELEPDNAKYHAGLSATLYAMKRYSEALAERCKAVELEPDNAEYHASLSAILCVMKRYDEALDEAKKAVELEADNVEYHTGCSTTLHAMKRYDEALEEAKKAVKLEPDNAMYHYQLSTTLRAMKRYDEALEEAKKAVKLEPDNAMYHYQLSQ